MPRANLKKNSDGTGRDRYITEDRLATKGRENLTVASSPRPFRDLELRKHSPIVKSSWPLESTEGWRPPSLRRGGPGWHQPIHPEDRRRSDESFNSTLASLASTVHSWESGPRSHSPNKIEEEQESKNAIRQQVKQVQEALKTLHKEQPTPRKKKLYY
eukprot:TRINITY_DN55219_c0_g1_i1.p1 TRINITY_DN55219_c0_g1~~TRINITY_DN55219_c0_g1_i1.p1  ORF type:complete len:158 (-),score=21.97 TRINITY_DN55219_c0_g1_i1:134-607(-)